MFAHHSSALSLSCGLLAIAADHVSVLENTNGLSMILTEFLESFLVFIKILLSPFYHIPAIALDQTMRYTSQAISVLDGSGSLSQFRPLDVSLILDQVCIFLGINIVFNKN